MKHILLVITLAFFYSSPSIAASKGESYGGLQYALVTYDEDGFDEVEPTALVGRYGHFVSDYVAIEGRIGFGLQDDTVDAGAFDIDIEVDSLYGVYGVFHTSSSSDTNFYGVLGFTRGELEGSAFGLTVSEDDSGLSYGFGVNIKWFNIEYMHYLDDDDWDATAISLGFTTEF